MTLLSWLNRPVRQIIPTLLTAYLLWAIKCTVWDVAYRTYTVDEGRQDLGIIYATTAVLLVGTITAMFVCLWWLPHKHSPPPARQDWFATVIECPAPPSGQAHVVRDGEEEIVVSHCASCGTDKPPRTRHCRPCGVCRDSYDHHCPTIATCLTVAYIPCFLYILILGPVAALGLAAPMYSRMWHQAATAWRVAASIPSPPVFTFYTLGVRAVAFVNAWTGPPGLPTASMFFLAHLLVIVCVTLGYYLISFFRVNDLSIDRLRASAYSQAATSAARAKASHRAVPFAVAVDLARFSPTCWFFVPAQDEPGVLGVVLPTLDSERPYDLTPPRNWDALVARGRGWRWILPWNAVRAMPRPAGEPEVAAGVRARLEEEAGRVLAEERLRREAERRSAAAAVVVVPVESPAPPKTTTRSRKKVANGGGGVRVKQETMAYEHEHENGHSNSASIRASNGVVASASEQGREKVQRKQSKAAAQKSLGRSTAVAISTAGAAAPRRSSRITSRAGTVALTPTPTP